MREPSADWADTCADNDQPTGAPVTRLSDELRTAASKLRDLATAASTDNDGTPTARWHTKPCWPKDDDGNRFLYGDHLTRDDGQTISWPLLLQGGMRSRAPYMHGQHADYAAAMDPTVGLALAEVFTAWARIGELDPDLLNRDAGPETIALARAINGSQP